MAAVVLAAAAGCGPVGQPGSGGTDLTVEAADGLKIAATLNMADAPQSPGLILIHMYGSNRSAWEPFAGRAQREGYSVIAIDMRGHGDTASLNPKHPRYRSFSTEEWRNVLLDIGAAKQALVEAGADADRIGLIGASIGANLAAMYAAEHSDVQALVLLSPGKDYKGIRVEPAFAQYGKRPSLLVTSEGDRYSAETSRALHRSAVGFCELREFPGVHHGTNILDDIPNAAGQILQWCNTVLRDALPAQTPGEVR